MKTLHQRELFGVREPGRLTAAGLVEFELGQEAVQRVMEQDDGFWNHEAAEERMPVRRLTRPEAIDEGYNVSKNYA